MVCLQPMTRIRMEPLKNGKYVPVGYTPDYLDNIAESDREKEDRKNRMLDHLLARFGETIPELSISSFQPALHKVRMNDDYLATSIEIKSKILRHYEQISQMRSRAADYSRNIWSTWETYKQIAFDYLREKEEKIDEYVLPERTKTQICTIQLFNLMKSGRKLRNSPTTSQNIRTRSTLKTGLIYPVWKGKFQCCCTSSMILNEDWLRRFLTNPYLELPTKEEIDSSGYDVTKKIIRDATWQEEDLKIEMDEWTMEEMVDKDEDLEGGRFTFEINSKNGLPQILKYGINKQNLSNRSDQRDLWR